MGCLGGGGREKGPWRDAARTGPGGSIDDGSSAKEVLGPGQQSVKDPVEA